MVKDYNLDQDNKMNFNKSGHWQPVMLMVFGIYCSDQLNQE